MSKCRHDIEHDCPACMQEELDDWKQAAGVEAGLRREFLARAERAEKALEKIALMDPWGKRADDLGRAARIARDALADVGGGKQP